MKRSTFLTWDQLKVGTMILVALLVMIVAVYQLGRAANLFTERYELVALLPNANGLREGGSVTVAGQLAGTVKSIRFLPVDGDTMRNLEVVLQLDKELTDQIRGDSRGKVRTLGLLGDKIVDISPGTPRHAVMAEGDTILMGESLDYEQVISQASAAVDDMVQLTHDLREISGGIVRGEGTMGQLITNRSLYDELTSTLTRTNQMMARMQNPNGTFGKILDDPAMYQNMTKMIASVDTLVVQLGSNEGTLGKLLRDDSLYTNMVGIAQRADSLMKMLTQGDGFANKLLSDQKLYDQLNKAVTDLNAILADVRRDPGKYTKGMIKVF